MINKTLTPEQQEQERQYIRPYHYFMDRNSFSGIFYFSYVEKSIEIIKKMSNRDVLDAGCGDGFFVSLLDDHKHALTGVDYSERAISFARVFNQDKNINFVVGDMENLPFGDESFDLVTNIAVLEHIKKDSVRKCTKEFHRVLRSGGYLLIAVPTHNLVVPAKHFQHFNIDQIKEIFKDDFDIAEVYGVCNNLFFKILKLFDNRYYDIRIFSRPLKTKIFNKFFAESSLSFARMMVIVLKKR